MSNLISAALLEEYFTEIYIIKTLMPRQDESPGTGSFFFHIVAS